MAGFSPPVPVPRVKTQQYRPTSHFVYYPCLCLYLCRLLLLQSSGSPFQVDLHLFCFIVTVLLGRPLFDSESGLDASSTNNTEGPPLLNFGLTKIMWHTDDDKTHEQNVWDPLRYRHFKEKREQSSLFNETTLMTIRFYILSNLY